jgi:hypothetical protein
MVSEIRVHTGKINFRHVTGHTLGCTDRASGRSSTLSLRVSWLREMTRETLRVVETCFLLQLFMRIVTRNTSNTDVVGVVSRAIEDPIRLKADIVDTRLARHQHGLLKTGVTCATKRLSQVERIQFRRIEHLPPLKFTRLYSSDMPVTWSMTSFTAYSGTKLIKLQYSSMNSSG